MRTIKFRGKDIETGQWIDGCLFQRIGYMPSIIFPYESNGKVRYSECSVIRETIGQFTGLHDKNGKEIYEGDIMRIPETETNIEIIGVVKFDRGSYFIRSFFSGTHSSLAWAVRERQPGEQRGVVIGNLYDNPELLKGDDDV